MKKKRRFQIEIDSDLLQLLSQVHNEMKGLYSWEIDHIRLALSNEPFPLTQPTKSGHAEKNPGHITSRHR